MTIKVRNIFAAVSEKTVLDHILSVLDPKTVKFLGTQGTVDYLKSKGFSAQSVVSGFDFDGRVKSLDKTIFARILADRSNKKHLEELRKLYSSSLFPRHSGESPRGGDDARIDSGQVLRLRSGRARMTQANSEFAPFDLVIVDLYHLDKNNFPESMDIGGQALIRAAIKNYAGVALAFDASSLASLVNELISNNRSTTLNFRKTQAQKAADFIARRTKLETDLFQKI